LYQRNKGRDLFDLWYGITVGKANPSVIAEVFQKYLAADGLRVSQREFRQNLAAKIEDPDFVSDIEDLLRLGLKYDHRQAHQYIEEHLTSVL
jgi:predicted nucleotidyltransferase component of viral defense system